MSFDIGPSSYVDGNSVGNNNYSGTKAPGDYSSMTGTMTGNPEPWQQSQQQGYSQQQQPSSLESLFKDYSGTKAPGDYSGANNDEKNDEDSDSNDSSRSSSESSSNASSHQSSPRKISPNKTNNPNNNVQPVVIVQNDESVTKVPGDHSWIDYRWILFLGFALALLAALWAYYVSQVNDLPINDECNMTMLYAVNRVNDTESIIEDENIHNTKNEKRSKSRLVDELSNDISDM